MLTEDSLSITSSLTLLVLFLTVYMFSDTLRGGVDMASASVRYLYNKASSNLGISSFSDEELTADEKERNITRFRDAQVGGLFNEGNTCFINSVLQALASCDPLRDYLNQFKDEMNFSGGLNHTITYLNQIHTRRHGYSTLKLMRQVGSSDRWNRFNQEDAQEFFQMLLNTLENDYKALEKEGLEKKEELSNNSATNLSTKPIYAVGEKATQIDGTEQSQSQGKDAVDDDVSDGESQAEPNAASSNGEVEEKKSNDLKLITPFDGCFAMRVGCMRCNDMEGIRTGVLSSVDLSLGETNGSVTLDELLQNYCAMETIDGVECYRCSLLEWRKMLCTKKESADNDVIAKLFTDRIAEVDAVLSQKVIDEKKYKQLKVDGYRVQSDKTKQIMFSKPLPKVLMIHINRSFYDLRSGIARKNFAPVTFPIDLDLSPFVADPKDESNFDAKYPMHGLTNDPQMYRLTAAVIHYGSANYGHYVTFRKYHGFWWRISDDQVTLTTEAQVKSLSSIFMLFYERVDACKNIEDDLKSFESEVLESAQTAEEGDDYAGNVPSEPDSDSEEYLTDEMVPPEPDSTLNESP